MTKASIRTYAEPRCILCGEEGRPQYTELRDRLFDAPGTWSLARCPDERCGLLWLDPMPAAEDLHKAYASYYTHASPARTGILANLFAAAKRGYAANHFGYEGASLLERTAGLLPWIYPGRAAELDFSVMWLHAANRGRLLDVGAGSGWLVEHMARLGWQSQGLDLDPVAVERARSRGLAVELGSLADGRLAAGSFDAVTMSHSIEHVHDPIAMLVEARRVLKRGGRLALATPNTRSLLHRRFGIHWFALDPPRHLRLFNRAALATALEKAGFSKAVLFTSVRGANAAYLGSLSIRRAGRFDMEARPRAVEALTGRAFQLGEAWRLLSDQDAGEDLVALAEA